MGGTRRDKRGRTGAAAGKGKVHVWSVHLLANMYGCTPDSCAHHHHRTTPLCRVGQWNYIVVSHC